MNVQSADHLWTAQVETKLVSEVNSFSDNNAAESTRQNKSDRKWNGCSVPPNGNMEINEGCGLDPMDGIGSRGQSEFDFKAAPSSTTPGAFVSQELISLGLQEPLPTDQAQDELWASIHMGAVDKR